jgi:FlaG/FlaF family flagellin (archaellin)
MRLVLPLAALVLLAAPAYAQTTPPVPAASPATPPAATRVPHHRTTMDQRFTKANTSNDGHLTLVQAKVGYPTVARHFTDIDATKKGYITEGDIRAWEKAKRDQRHAAQPTTVTPNKS